MTAPDFTPAAIQRERERVLGLLQGITERRSIPSVPGYEADSEGNIWSIASNWRGYGERILKTTLNRDGYPIVFVKVDGKQKHPTVHKLIAEAFLGPCPVGQQVCHINGIRADSRPENLRYGTAKDNANDRAKHGHTACGAKHWARRTPGWVTKGERVGTAKLTAESVVEIRRLRSLGATYQQLADKFGVDQSNIGTICKRKSWKHI